jgi:PAS domain S-box-containing protein
VSRLDPGLPDIDRLLLDTAPVLVVVLDLSGRVVRMNRFAEERTGRRQEDVLGTDWFEGFVPEIDRDKVRGYWQDALEDDGTGRQYLNRILGAGGDHLWISWSTTLVHQGGEVVGLLAVGNDVTESRRATETLRLMGENVPDVFWMANPTVDRILYVSPGYEQLWGRSISELEQDPRGFTAGVHPDDLPGLWSLDAPRSDPWDLQYRIVRPDGEVRWVRGRGFPVLEQGGSICCFAGTVTDITELKQVELKLGRKTELARLVAEVAQRLVAGSPDELDSDLDWALGRIGRVAGADRCLLVDLEADVRISHEWHSDRVGPRLGETFDLPADVVEADRRQLVEPGLCDPFELPGVRLLGGRIEAKTLDVAPLLAGSEVVGALAVTSTSTICPWQEDCRIALRSLAAVIASAMQRARGHHALEQNLELFRTLLDTIPSPVFYKDLAGRYLGCNQAFAEFLGTTTEELVGRTVYELGQGATADTYKSADEELLARGGQQFYEGEVRRHDGEQRDALFSKATWQGADGRIAGLVGVVTDLTERNHGDRALRRHRAQLRALSSQLALVEEGERRRTASMLHDEVGQELAVLKLRLGLLGRRVTGEAEEQVHALRQRMGDLIDRTRAMTADLAPPALFKLGLAPALEALVREQVRPHGVDVALRQTGAPAALPEGLQLFAWRATRELVANCLAYAGASRIDLELRWTDGLVELRVTDDGRGFDPSVLSPERGLDAPGFGLIQLRERLQHMGGGFEVRSNSGEGTQVRLTIPVGTGAGGDTGR